MNVDTKYKFRVIHTINYRLFDKIYDVVNTYEIELERILYKDLRIKLSRNNFKINDKKIETKFERIAHEYNNTLFPVLFDGRKNFLLANFQEIEERIAQKDHELRLKHEGPGFDYIRKGFLEKAADGYAMAKYLFSFGLIRVILLCLEKPENNLDYNFYWEAIPIDSDVFWNGKKAFDPELNILKYEGESHDNEALFEKIKSQGNDYQYPEKVTDEDAEIISTIKHEIQYNTTELDFMTSETEIKISNSYFNYFENFSITAFSKTEI